MTLSKIYTGSGAAFAVATFLLLSVSPPPSIRHCLARIADSGGISALSGPPNVVGYSVYKGFLWPVSLVNSVGFSGMSFGDWLLNRYDPFNGAC